MKCACVSATNMSHTLVHLARRQEVGATLKLYSYTLVILVHGFNCMHLTYHLL